MDQKKGERELIYIDQGAKHLWPETISYVWCTKIINRNNIFPLLYLRTNGLARGRVSEANGEGPPHGLLWLLTTGHPEKPGSTIYR